MSNVRPQLNNPPVAPQVVSAPLWSRALSRAIDLLLVAVLVAAFLYIAHKFGAEYFPLNDAIVFAVILGYEVLIPAVTRGATLGRLLVRTRLVREANGSTPSFFQHVARTASRVALFALFAIFVAYEIDLPSFLFVCIVEGIVCAVRSQHQTVGDLVARTMVVRKASRAKTAA